MGTYSQSAALAKKEEAQQKAAAILNSAPQPVPVISTPAVTTTTVVPSSQSTVNPYAGKTGPNGEIVNSVGTYQNANGMNTQYVEPPKTDAGAVLAEQDRIAAEGVVNEDLKDLGKVGKQYGVETGPDTIQGVVDKFKADQAEAKAYAEKQNATAQYLDQSQYDTSKAQAEGSIAANNAANAQGREGAMSGSAPKIKSEFATAVNKQISDNKVRLDSATAARNNMMAELQKAQQSGNESLVKSISGSLAAAKVRVQEAQAAQLNSLAIINKQAEDLIDSVISDGSLAEMTPEQVAIFAEQNNIDPVRLKAAANAAFKKQGTSEQQLKLDNTIKGINSLGTIFQQGSKMDVGQLTSLAKSLGVSMDTASSLYQGFETTRNDKTLSADEAALKNRGLLQETIQKEKGVFTQNAQDIEYIKSLYKRGDSESAHLMERRLGIDDLSYQAELAVKNAQIAYQKSATSKNYQDLLTAKAEYNDTYGETSYVPNGKYEVESTTTPDGQQAIRIGVEEGQALDIPGTERREDWCGAFTNDVLGTEFGDLFTQKMSLVNSNTPASGMAFIQATADENGHVGVVEKVNLAAGTMDVVEANWQKGSDGKGIISRRTMNIADAAGFIKPANSIPMNTDVTVESLTEKYVSQKVPRKQAKEQAIKDILNGAGTPLQEVPQEYNWASTIIDNSFGDAEGGKAAARKQNELATVIKNNDGKSAKNIVYNAILKNTTSTERVNFEDAVTMNDSYSKLQTVLGDFEKAGLDTGLAGNTISKIYEKMTAERPKEAVALKTRLEQAFNAYRKAITGAGASTGELEMLKNSMPTFDKNLQEIKEMANIVHTDASDALDRKVEGLSRGAFSSYKEMKDQLRSLSSIGQEQSPMIQGFLDDPSADQAQKDSVKKFLDEGGDPAETEKGILKYFGNKYSVAAQNSINPTNQASKVLQNNQITPHATGSWEAILSKNGVKLNN